MVLAAVEGREVVFASTTGVGVSRRDGSTDANRGEVDEGPYSDVPAVGVSRVEKKSEKYKQHQCRGSYA